MVQVNVLIAKSKRLLNLTETWLLRNVTGIRTCLKTDIQSCVSELVFGTTLWVTEEFIIPWDLDSLAVQPACPCAREICLRHKLVYNNDSYSFQSNSVLVLTHLFWVNRCTNRYRNLTKAHFTWFIVTYNTYKDDLLDRIDKASIGRFKVAHTGDSVLPNSSRFDVNATLPRHSTSCNFLCLLRIRVSLSSHVQVSCQLNLLCP